MTYIVAYFSFHLYGTLEDPVFTTSIPQTMAMPSQNCHLGRKAAIKPV